VLDDIEYVVENGIIVRRSTRDKTNKLLKVEYLYFKENPYATRFIG
jgi:hypothetical protein